jgi:hypothetical protein
LGYISHKDKKFIALDEAFLYMIKELLDDVKDAGVILPYDYEQIYKFVYLFKSHL